MLIFAGHHLKNQGAVNDISSELIEASILGAMISSDDNSIFLGSSILREKVKLINTTCDSLNIEIHYSTSIGASHGPKVYYKENCSLSQKAANSMQEELNKIDSSTNQPEIGYYHNKKEFGLDYFLKNNYPSIIICPEHWDRYTNIILKRKQFCGAIQKSISKLIEG